MSNILISNPNFLYAMNKFTADLDIVKDCLQAVLIEPHHEKGITLTASNRHAIATLHDLDGVADTTCLVSLNNSEKGTELFNEATQFKQQIKLKKNKKKPIFMTIEETASLKQAFIIATLDNKKYKLVATNPESYPNWRKVIPNDKDNYTLSRNGHSLLSAPELANFISAANILGGQHNNVLKIEPPNSDSIKGTLISIQDSDFSLFGYLMPSTDANHNQGVDIPSWTKTPDIQ